MRKSTGRKRFFGGLPSTSLLNTSLRSHWWTTFRSRKVSCRAKVQNTKYRERKVHCSSILLYFSLPSTSSLSPQTQSWSLVSILTSYPRTCSNLSPLCILEKYPHLLEKTWMKGWSTSLNISHKYTPPHLHTIKSYTLSPCHSFSPPFSHQVRYIEQQKLTHHHKGEMKLQEKTVRKLEG